MTNQDDLTLLYICSEIDAQVLKEILEENNIGTHIRNDMTSAKAAGFGGGYYGVEVKMYVTEKDLDNAKTILEEFKKASNQK